MEFLGESFDVKLIVVKDVVPPPISSYRMYTAMWMQEHRVHQPLTP